jgi:hypothetical protein
MQKEGTECRLTSNPPVQAVPFRSNELWLHRPPVAEDLSRAIEWAEKHPPKASKLDAIERKLGKRR